MNAQFRDVTCPICKFTYVEGYGPDVRAHRDFHNKIVKGISWKPLKSDEIISISEISSTLLINPMSSMAQRQRAQRVAYRAKLDTPYDFVAYRASDSERDNKPRVFITIKEDYAVGFLVIRYVNHICETDWTPFDSDSKERIALHLQDKDRWAISMIWTLPRSQKQGIATQLIHLAAKYVEYKVADLAWTIPFTSTAKSLSQKICKEKVTITW